MGLQHLLFSRRHRLTVIRTQALINLRQFGGDSGVLSTLADLDDAARELAAYRGPELADECFDLMGDDELALLLRRELFRRVWARVSASAPVELRNLTAAYNMLVIEHEVRGEIDSLAAVVSSCIWLAQLRQSDADWTDFDLPGEGDTGHETE